MNIKRTNIAYADFSGGDLNFIMGCTPVSTECENCYARALIARFGGDPNLVRVSPEKLERLVTVDFPGVRLPAGAPFRRGDGSRPLAFICNMSDLFHPAVPDQIIVRAFQVFRYRQDVDWLVLTKRPERAQYLLPGAQTWTRNIWFGVTVGHPASIRRLIDQHDVPSAVRWLSAEPLLAPLDLEPFLPGLDWVVCGGESGPNRRPFDIAWARNLHDQCARAGVPYFYKQGSALRPGADPTIDGMIYHEFPGENRR